jgi:hypothetical protein
VIFRGHQYLHVVARALAIYALVLQGLFGALIQGESVGARFLAAELGVICAPSGHGHDAPGQRQHDGSCCLAACRAVGAGPAVLPQTITLARTEGREIALPAVRHERATVASSTRVPPARGPPVAG